MKSIVTVPLTRHEYSALVILSHNIGNGALRDSTIVKRLNAGDKKGAADAAPRLDVFR